MPRTLSIADLRRKLAVKEGQLAKLQGQRDRLAKQLAGIEREIAVLGGAPAKAKPKRRKKTPVKKGRRVRRGASLVDVLAKVLAGKGHVRVAEAAKLALAAGHKSNSSQFGNIVSQALSDDGRFKKIARGVYVLKGEKTTPAKRSSRKIAKVGGKAESQQSLGDLLADVAKGRKLLGVADATRLILAKGYKSRAKNFQLAVNRALMRDKRFGRVARGTYTLKE